jgi:hypothetical protein
MIVTAHPAPPCFLDGERLLFFLRVAKERRLGQSKEHNLFAGHRADIVVQTKDVDAGALSAEVQAIADYTARIGQAETCGELGLKVALEGQLADETRHKEEIERIIEGWYEVNPERDLKENRLQDVGGQG